MINGQTGNIEKINFISVGIVWKLVTLSHSWTVMHELSFFSGTDNGPRACACLESPYHWATFQPHFIVWYIFYTKIQLQDDKIDFHKKPKELKHYFIYMCG